VAASLTAVILTACSATKDKAPILVNPGISNPYPPLESDLKTSCKVPVDQEGDDVYLSRKKNRNALKVCKDKHADVVQFYEKLRKTKR
jgi:hypothetical protein